MIGAVGVGVFNDLPEAAKSMVHIGSRYEPLTKNIPRYNEMYEVSLSTYEAREGGDVFRKIARAQGL